MTKTIYVDGAAELQVQGQIIRVNLVVNSPTERDVEGNRIREVRYELVMSPQAVTELHRGLTGALEHLAKSGVVSKHEPGTPAEVLDN